MNPFACQADKFKFNFISQMILHPEFILKTVDKLASDSEFISGLETKLDLDFVPEKVTGNLCFANNSDEIRDDFKQVFTSADLSDYLYAVLHSQLYQKRNEESSKLHSPNFPYPKDTETFWKLTGLGEIIREIYSSEEPKEDISTFVSPEVRRLMEEIDKIVVG